MTTTTTLSCLGMFAFAIAGLSLLFYLLYRNKFGAAVVTALCLVLGTCAVLVRPQRQQDARAPEPAAVKPAPSVTSSSSEQATAPPAVTIVATPTATLTTVTPPVTETRSVEAAGEVKTSTTESASRRRAIARLLLDPGTLLFHEPTCPAARGLSTKASPSVARIQGYQPHDCVRKESSEE